MGVEKQVVQPGNGITTKLLRNFTIHWTGYVIDGNLSPQKFQSTKDPGRNPFTFRIGERSVIKGWEEGIPGMQVGEIARLRCSPDYAFGAGGFPAWGVPPNSVLEFEIEVLSAY